MNATWRLIFERHQDYSVISSVITIKSPLVQSRLLSCRRYCSFR